VISVVSRTFVPYLGYRLADFDYEVHKGRTTTLDFMNKEDLINIESPAKKRIALVAHDNMKSEMLEWAKAHHDVLSQHVLLGTGTTGRLVAEQTGLEVERLRSGPLGGDQQLGARIADREIDILLFFWDPLEPQPHDPDIKALLRIAVVWNIPVACNRASADFLMSSPLVNEIYQRRVPNY
jgi:methylglyoxal synthase